MRHLPNLICLLRIALVWPVVELIWGERYAEALGLFVVAAVSDGLDGFLAKRFGWTSELGKFLDPLADKLLLVAMFITTTWCGLVPWWLAAAVIARDVSIGLGALVYRLWFGPLRGRPTWISKANTAMQLAYILAVILRAGFDVPPREVVDALAVIAFVTTVASGADYMRIFTSRAWATTTGGTPAASA